MAEQELKKISQEELDEILEQHKLWVESKGQDGIRADLSFYDLREEVNLRGANLREADLMRANLIGADLREANLRGADLRGANLRGADLRGADLRGADLRGANLIRADLSGADLMKANLIRANLSGAELFETNLDGAHLDGARGIPLSIRSTTNLEEQTIQQQFKINQLEQKLQKIQAENNQSQEQQEKIAELEKQLELAKQQEQELQKLKEEKEKLEKDIKEILKTNIDEAHKALTNALTNTGKQITNNQRFSRSLSWLAVILICSDIAFVLAIPFLIMAGTLNELLDKTGIWAILFFTFPALLILLIALSLLRHQKQLIAEIRH